MGRIIRKLCYFSLQEYRMPVGFIEQCGDVGPELNARQAVIIEFFLSAFHTFSISVLWYN